MSWSQLYIWKFEKVIHLGERSKKLISFVIYSTLDMSLASNCSIQMVSLALNHSIQMVSSASTRSILFASLWPLTNDMTECSELEPVTPIECFDVKPMTPFGCCNLKPMTPYECCNLKPMTYWECCILRILLVFYFFFQNEKVFQIFKCIVVIRTKIPIF